MTVTLNVPFHGTWYRRRQVLRAKVAGFFSSILDGAQVPNILWGEQAVDMFIDEEHLAIESRTIEFVVTDDSLDTAVRELDSFDQHKVCVDPNCILIQPNQDLPVPDAHFHTPFLQRLFTLGWVTLEKTTTRNVVEIDTISLFAKSRTLWWLPDSTLHSSAKCTDIMDISDYHSWSVDWQNLYPVKILQPMALAEALIFLLARDHRHQTNSGFIHWKKLIFTMSRQCLIDERIRTIRSDFQAYWSALHDAVNDLDHLLALLPGIREKLIEAREMPPVNFGFIRPPLYSKWELVDLVWLKAWGEVYDLKSGPLTDQDRDMKQSLLKSFLEYSSE
ncbi:hypothetical protein N7448_010145 [Penicillium atrosanguineum]|uniref:Uncharacterized protein n=1 Tax=Penicillium atrosanguineum TaxID=1132637 RepID=A0A9W9GFL3_9EURO|nr:cell surface protein [Penicillium atrosanguineum]KAJ5119476.1 hypothetical protein N7448_010145 [Penicillium atrosanguineum]KAJ5296474.1 cell surface protein [Penicillium atrosanguineum]KAJ5299242.1 hypothetical protein N7476_010799 [Penicillium atrosanguineum]